MPVILILYVGVYIYIYNSVITCIRFAVILGLSGNLQILAPEPYSGIYVYFINPQHNISYCERITI